MNKYNVKIFLVAVFFLCFLNIRVVFAMMEILKDEEELTCNNYAAVHYWKNKLKGGRRVGHAALQICENGKLDENLPNYISLYPSERSADTLLSSVKSNWHTPEEDGPADAIVRLYSLDLNGMKKGFKQTEWYTLTGNGTASPFVDDLDSRNCASIVRDVLIFGDIGYLFQSSEWSLPRALPAAGETIIGSFLGLGGGLLGGGFGFLKGAVTLQNPFYEAWEDSKKAAKVCSDVPLNWASQNWSVMNTGHQCIESLIVTPEDVLTLANDARSIEKTMFPRSESWE